MEPSNPYATPSANPYGSNPLSMEGSVAAETIAPLAGTKGWVQFMSVIMWLLAALCIFYAVVMIAMQGFVAKAIAQQQPGNPMAQGPFMAAMGGFYLFLAFFYIYPAVKLWAYGSRIGTLKTSLRVQDLNAALHEQRRLWKFTGIMTIVFMVLMVLGVMAFVAFVGIAASRTM
jgi:preprotein translocase subunit SecG